MAINLTKGDQLDIAGGLSKVGVGLGWDPNVGESQNDYDLDASAFMLGKNRKLISDDYFVFYNNQKSPDNAVETSGDDQTGGNSDGDDETITVDLKLVDPRVSEIVFTVTIDKWEEKRQNFGQIRNSFIRIYNMISDEEIARYELNEDFSTETAIEFGKLIRNGNSWKFEAIGIGYGGGLRFFCQKYE